MNWDRIAMKFEWKLEKILGCLGASLFMLACGGCFWMGLVTWNDAPDMGEDTARMEAVRAGFYPAGGCMATWVREPDFYGGSEVQVEFSSLAEVDADQHAKIIVRLNRSTALSNWQLVSVKHQPGRDRLSPDK